MFMADEFSMKTALLCQENYCFPSPIVLSLDATNVVQLCFLDVVFADKSGDQWRGFLLD
jgi:hypothetical protein